MTDNPMQAFLLSQFAATQEKVSGVASEISGLKGEMEGVKGQLDHVASLVTGMAARSEVNVTGTDNSQIVHAGGDALVGRDGVSKSTNNFSIEKVVEKAKENPLATAGLGGGLWYFWPKIQAMIETMAR